ncbi:MAG: sulfite oxidase [Thermoplasmata archaeon]|nr:sulfite oxidase [Thermoplasmata archaeon]
MISPPGRAGIPRPPPTPGGAVEEPPNELDVLTRLPLCAEAALTLLGDPITPTPRFFIRNHFPAPRLELASWRLVIDGEVERPVSLSYEDLVRLPRREGIALLECAGNSRSGVNPPTEGVRWSNGAVGAARWAGVPLASVLERAGVKPGAKEVVFEGADRGREPDVPEELQYAMSISIEKARDGDTLLADRMNGAPLSVNHGFPVRAIVPDWYGMASVKWVTKLTVIDHAFQGYFRTRPYVYIHEGDSVGGTKTPVTVQRVKSLITWPGEGQPIRPGRHTIRGVAWSGGGPISRVELSVGRLDPATEPDQWRPTRLTGDPALHSWTPWEYEIELARPGYYVFRVRATDAHGNTQPVLSPWNFRGVGINSVHQLPVVVEGEPLR